MKPGRSILELHLFTDRLEELVPYLEGFNHLYDSLTVESLGHLQWMATFSGSRLTLAQLLRLYRLQTTLSDYPYVSLMVQLKSSGGFGKWSEAAADCGTRPPAGLPF